MTLLDKVKLTLEKRAEASAANTAAAGAKKWHSYHKVGTTLGLTSLGLAVMNTVDAKRIAAQEQKRQAIEQKSLAALNRIHSALAIKAEPETF